MSSLCDLAVTSLRQLFESDNGAKFNAAISALRKSIYEGGLTPQDEVAIVDGCDRMVPLNMEAIPDLILALEKFYSLHIQSKLVAQLEMIALDSEAEAYVEDNEITVNIESFQSAIGNSGF